MRPKTTYNHSTLTLAYFADEQIEATHVPGGLDVTSYTTLFTPLTSFVIRDEIFFNTAGGKTNLRVSSCSPCHICGARLTSQPS